MEPLHLLTMPTATTQDGYGVINIGPLTTTFTAPASCTTEFKIAVAPTDSPSLEYQDDCSYEPPSDCHPHGSVINSLVSSIGATPTLGVILYQSPGLFCPSGWSTAGAATKVNPTSTSTSGAFNLTNVVPTGVPAFFQPALDSFMSALDPGETAIACCPRFLSFLI